MLLFSDTYEEQYFNFVKSNVPAWQAPDVVYLNVMLLCDLRLMIFKKFFHWH